MSERLPLHRRGCECSARFFPNRFRVPGFTWFCRQPKEPSNTKRNMDASYKSSWDTLRACTPFVANLLSFGNSRHLCGGRYGCVECPNNKWGSLWFLCKSALKGQPLNLALPTVFCLRYPPCGLAWWFGNLNPGSYRGQLGDCP